MSGCLKRHPDLNRRINMDSARKRQKRRAQVRKFLPIYFMAVPGILYMIVNNYMPITGLVVAFKSYSAKRGIFGSKWVGLANFEYLFKTKDAFLITRNTILYNLAFIALSTLLAIVLAICLNEVRNKYFSRFSQTVILLPHLISIVVVSFLVYAFLSTDTGLFNNLIERQGGKKISWYMEPKYWPYILTVVYLWKEAGYYSIVYLASIVGIDRGYYEAAELDGANKWQQITMITIPLISPLIIMMVLLSIGRIFYSDFGLFYQVPMRSGPIQDVTSTIDTYVYRGLMQLGDVGMSAAASLYQSIVGFILILASNLYVKKIRPESSLF